LLIQHSKYSAILSKILGDFSHWEHFESTPPFNLSVKKVKSVMRGSKSEF